MEENQPINENEKEMIKCMNPRCSNTFPRGFRHKKYCSDNCRAIHNFSLRYLRLKDNPEFIEKNKIKSEIYYQRNKERLKLKMRENAKLRKLKKEEKLDDNGNNQS